jgi:OFA family oxalate/formate antiporter-like MFS transporter
MASPKPPHPEEARSAVPKDAPRHSSYRTPPRLPVLLAGRLPFFYGWIVLGVLCCAGFARQGPAVSTLSVFVTPLISDFGWSRTALSGAVSLGGILAAIVSPLIGPFLDRAGSRLLLSYAVLTTGAALLLLSLSNSLVMFYILFCFARMNWASPFELGIYGAVNNWFVARRRFATSVATLAQMAGLVTMPLIAQFAMLQSSWRAGWLAIGLLTLAVGFLPTALLLVRRPEDIGLAPDGGCDAPVVSQIISAPAIAGPAEGDFSRAQAVRVPTFWLLLSYTVLVYPIQAGISLHMAPHLNEHGIAPAIVATIVSTYSLMSAAASLACGFLPRRLPIRYPMAATGVFLTASPLLMTAIATPGEAYLAAALFGFGVGGILTLLPIAWADYFGRAHFGAIRGVALSAQVVAQAAGPLISGAFRDRTGDYQLSLALFAALGGLSVVAALAASRPKPL